MTTIEQRLCQLTIELDAIADLTHERVIELYQEQCREIPEREHFARARDAAKKAARAFFLTTLQLQAARGASRRAARAADLICSISPFTWGAAIDFRGTAEQLVAAGIVLPEMLVVGKSGKRSSRDREGNSVTATYRHADATYLVERHFNRDRADEGSGPARHEHESHATQREVLAWLADEMPTGDASCARTVIEAARRFRPRSSEGNDGIN